MPARIERERPPMNRTCKASHDDCWSLRSASGRGGRDRAEATAAESKKKPESRRGGTGRNSLVAVGLPHHHGVGVGGLAGGDGGGLVEDGGDGGESGHFDCWLLVCVVFVQLCEPQRPIAEF